MTAPARQLQLAPAGRADHGDPRLWTRLILVIGLPLLIGAFALTATDVGGQVLLWENLHWTIAPVVALVLAALRTRTASEDRRALRAITLGIGIYLVGTLVWLVQASVGFYAVPAPSDVFYLLSSLPIAAGFVVAANEKLPSEERVALVLDVLTVFAALVAVILATLGGIAASVPPIAAATYLAYPIADLAAAGGVSLAVISMRVRPRLGGQYLVLAGLATMGMAWVIWVSDAFTAFPPPGSLVNYAFSVAILLIGIGAATWTRSDLADERSRRFSSTVVAVLPVAAVAVSVAVLLLDAVAGRQSDASVEIAVGGAVLLALARQTLLLRERGRGVARERVAAEHERLVAGRAREAELAAQDALAAYRESEERYRLVADVFTKLGEQVTLSTDETALLKAAASALHRMAPSDHGDVLIVNPSQDRLTVAAAWGPGALDAGALVEVDAPVRCLGIRRGAIYLVDDLSDDLQLACPAHPAATGSVMCVPMVALGQVMGVIHLGRSTPVGFESDDKRQASRVAEQVALAVANGRLMRTMEQLALTDPLTGLHNARFFDPFLDRELATAERDDQPLGILMIDLDHFKRFNDTYGHPAGDEALRGFARATLRVLRASDTLARYGGEEFVVAVRHADLAAAAAVGEKIRRAVQEVVVEIRPGETALMTVSVGVASTSAHGNDRMTLLRAADAALYGAKQAGRNRVTIAGG